MKNKNTEILSLSAEELATTLATEQARLLKLKFAHAITPLENHAQIRESRRHIARLHTELRKRSDA